MPTPTRVKLKDGSIVLMVPAATVTTAQPEGTPKVKTIRPGLLVSLKTALRGGVAYQRQELERSDTLEKWETTKTIEDPEEHARGIVARSRARTLVVGACARSTFGLLCPDARESELRQAIAQAQAVAADFNATARSCHLEVNAICGRIVSDDVQAIRAIGGEIRDMLDAIEQGIKACDADAVREAANKAREVSTMLSGETQAKVQAAIAGARSFARSLVALQKAGETAALTLDAGKAEAMRAARFAVIDMTGDFPDVQAPDAGPGRAVDLTPTERAAITPQYASPPPTIDL